MPGIASLCILSFLNTWNLIEQSMTFLRTQDKWPIALYLAKIGETNVDIAIIRRRQRRGGDGVHRIH
ncbi:MAG TPA: hypothetical protein PKE04_14910 [Clostridia bacterium]|nr:hypothetical protein [Clostridia bacterium]